MQGVPLGHFGVHGFPYPFPRPIRRAPPSPSGRIVEVGHPDYTLTLGSVLAPLCSVLRRFSALIALPLIRTAAECLEAPGILRFQVPQHVAVSVRHAHTKKRLSR